MIKLHVTEAAALSIVEQSDYYCGTSGPTLAHRWEEAVEKAIRSLLTWPERGAPCHLQSLALQDMRWIPIHGFPRHMLFYRYSAKEKDLLVVDVLYGARDLEALLSKDA